MDSSVATTTIVEWVYTFSCRRAKILIPAYYHERNASGSFDCSRKMAES